MDFEHLPHPAPVPGEPRQQALLDPGFGKLFGQPHEIDALYESTYVDVHRRYAASRKRMQEMLTG